MIMMMNSKDEDALALDLWQFKLFFLGCGLIHHEGSLEPVHVQCTFVKMLEVRVHTNHLLGDPARPFWNLPNGPFMGPAPRGAAEGKRDEAAEGVKALERRRKTLAPAEAMDELRGEALLADGCIGSINTRSQYSTERSHWRQRYIGRFGR